MFRILTLKIACHGPFLIKHIITVHVGCMGQLGFGDMRPYLQWKYYVEVSQCQHSLHHMHPKQKRFT